MRLGKSGSESRTRRFLGIYRAALSLAAALLVAGGIAPSAQAATTVGSWFEDNFEVHGFLTSKFYVRSSDLNIADRATISSWRSELNLEMDFFFYDGELNSPLTGEDESLRITGYAIVRPTYEAVYDINNKWGGDLNKAQYGTFGIRSNQLDSHRGKNFPGSGARVDDEFTVINNDTGSNFTGKSSPAICIDDRVFLGCVGSAVLPRNSYQERLGGPATIFDYQRLNKNGQAGFNQGLMDLSNSLALTGTEPGLGNAYLTSKGITPGTVGPLPGDNTKGIQNTATNFYAPGRIAGSDGHFGSSSSFDKGFDINKRQSSLSTDCFDAAHPFCWLREFYIDVEWGNTQMRLGRQQIVWGKTDAFRLQDKINPIDVGFHNIFPDLEERRIPVLALDIIHSFGDIGVFKDVSFEFAWIFDKYIGDQGGQCGEPYAFTGLCHFRADIGGHGVFNWGSRFYQEVDWNLQNTEPWARVEFRIPKPSISFSISAGWTHEDTPYAEFIQGTAWSYDNPNPSTMLFLQGVGVGGLIEQLAGAAPGTTPWTQGFDALSHTGMDANGDGIPDPSGTLAQANSLLLTAWQNSVGQCAAAGSNAAIGQCFDNSGLGVLAFPWVGSEAAIRVNRIFTVGGSLDYQVPRIDTIVRMEMAYDFSRRIQDTSVFKGWRSSDVFQFAIGLDRSTFIPFLNRNRTAFLSVQTFLSHIVDYNDVGSERGMVPYEDQVISTFFMQNYWRNDTLILTSFVAVLWKEENIVTGPSLRWVYNDHLFFDVGINLLWGTNKEMNIWDLCGGARDQGGAYSGVGCIGDPTTWAPGQWQTLNVGLEPASESAFGWARQGIADRFQRKRDEIWIGVTYQF